MKAHHRGELAAVMDAFEQEKLSEASKIRNKDGSVWCSDRFSVLVVIGQQISASTPVTKRYAPMNEEIPVLTVRLLSKQRVYTGGIS